MKSFIKFLIVLSLSVPVFAQGGNVPGPVTVLYTAPVNNLPLLLYYSNGQPVYGPSNLVDNGTQLLYKGAPIGAGGGITAIGASNTPLFNMTINNTNPNIPVVTPAINTQPAGTFYGNFGGTVTTPFFQTAGTLSPNFLALKMTQFPMSQFAQSQIVAPVTTGMTEELHFQEASGAVALTDFSGAGNNATVVGNINLPGTLFGGMNVAPGGGVPTGYALLNANVTGALTMQTYTCINSVNTPTASFYDTIISGLVSNTTPSGGTTQAFGLMLNGNQGNAFATGVLAKYAMAPVVFNNTALTTQSTESIGNGCYLITWTRGTSTDQLYINDHLVANYQFNTAGTSTVVPITNLALGTPPYATLSAAYEHPYPIYYHNAYSRALSLQEVAANYGSIQKYMEFRGVVKPSTAWTDGGNQLVVVGDSISYGFNAGNVGWPSQLSTNTTYTVTNLGSTGWQLENMISECESRGYGAFNPNSNRTVIIFGGTNELIGNTAGLPAATPIVTYQRLRRLVQCYKKQAPRVFITTTISRSSTPTGVNSGSTGDALKNSLNALERLDYAGADGLIDIASFAGLGADGASVITTGTACNGAACFTGDGTHPSVAGQTTMAGYFSAYLNYADSIYRRTNPTLITAATYSETAADTAIDANPISASQTVTLPTAVGLIGTERYIYNIQATGTNTVTIVPAAGENIDGLTTLTCANATKCSFRSVLGASVGLGAPASATNAGAHWEQQAGLGGSSPSGNATSIWSIPVGTAPTTGQLLGYNGTNIVGVNATGGTVPTGTGFSHITAGAQDGAARAVNLASADVTGILPIANLPVGSSTVAGILQCDGTTITCVGGLLTATGSGGGGAGLAANTFTGLQIMPSLQDTPVNDTGLVNAAVVANTSVTALSAGEIITFNPVATNTTAAVTLNVNSLGAKTVTRFGNVALAIGDLVLNTTAVVIYNSSGSGTWQLLNPATIASTASNQTFQGTQNFSTLNFTSVLQKGGVGVFPATRCIATTSSATTANCSATGTTTTGVCVAFPANSIAVTLNTTNAPFITVPTTNLPTLTFATAATAGAIYNVMCTPN